MMGSNQDYTHKTIPPLANAQKNYSLRENMHTSTLALAHTS